MDDYYFCYFPYCLVFLKLFEENEFLRNKSLKECDDMLMHIRDYVKRSKVVVNAVTV